LTATASKKTYSVQLIIGSQWGDEGKGKIVDLLGKDVDIVARYQGGPNAGHTVKFNNTQYILHQIPSGILRPDTDCIIGNGLVINPESLMNEIDTLTKAGIDALKRLYISLNAHLILDYHIAVECAGGSGESTASTIGTTGRGIGPAYADKISRIGIRMQDLLYPEQLKEKLNRNIKLKNDILQSVYGADKVDEQKIYDLLSRFTAIVKNNIVDTQSMLIEALKSGKKVLLEGAQGTHLDIDFGTYPYVTSSNTTVGGVFTGLGIAPNQIDRIIGIVKAYTTRVGKGPFPSELTGDTGDALRKKGSEFGATTGRPRRCGWFDSMVVRYAVETNGIDTMAITKLDVLDIFDEIKICTGYQYKGKKLSYFPKDFNVFDNIEPIYQSVKGWKQSIAHVRSYEELPVETKDYLKLLEDTVQVPVGFISVGPNREETIILS